MIFRTLLAVMALLFVLLVTAVLFIVEKDPLVNASAPEQVNNAETVNALLAQLERSLKDRHQSQQLTITESQFDSLVGFVQRATSDFRGQVNITPEVSAIYLTLALPYTRGHGFLNVSIAVLPGDRLIIDKVSLGDLTLPGSLAIGIAEWLVNTWTQSDIATYARAQVEQVSMTHDDVTLSLAPLDGLLKRLNEVKNGLTVEQDTELRDLTAYYLRYISWQDLSIDTQSHSLADYLQLTLARAAQRSTSDTAVLHNKAAILALAVFVGHHRIANFVGDIQPDAERALKPAKPALLRGREDLARHFIISAALKLLSEQGVSLAIGEFKELMDRAMGGSGYSFVDLAADMAGVEFAAVATDPDKAAEVQHLIGSVSNEDLFMPPVEGLPEGLSKRKFEEVYGRVDSDKYLQEVNEIKQRLKAMALYADSRGEQSHIE
ncbi:hypothetical protein [Alteromonas sp. H39]|uniref:hypothetical protein n=1 Tax=Alteromonas sp. H39 TaxID=3389876 RepID=UPI0039E13F81